MGTLLRDFRYGLRLLAKSPEFSAVAILTLALGIGANTAIFSLIDAVMLRALPVRDPGSLVVLEWHGRHEPKYQNYSSYDDCDEAAGGTSGCSFSYPFVRQVEGKSELFSGIASFSGSRQLDMTGNGPASIVHAQFVSGGFFQTLGIGAALGRAVEPADAAPGAAPVAVLQYGFWQRAFGGSPAVLGRTIRLNNLPFTIVGIAPRTFESLSPGKPYDLWLPLGFREQLKPDWAGNNNDAKTWWLVNVARLKPGVSREHAEAAISLMFRNHVLYGGEPLTGEADEPSVTLLPVETGLVGQRDQLRTPLYALTLAVCIVLVIACANVAGLLLARSAARAKEIAIRSSLGGSRWTIVRQLLSESLLLSCCGGVFGVAFAYAGVRAFVLMIARGPEQPFPFTVSPDLRVLAFTVSISVLSAVFFGLAPALRASRVDPISSMKDFPGSSGALDHRSVRWFKTGNAITVAQFALAVIVLAGAGLLMRTLHNLRSLNPGFDSRNVLVFGIDPTLSGYKLAETRNLDRELRERLAALPGVVAVSYSAMPLVGGRSWTREVHVEGQPSQSRLQVNVVEAGPAFLNTMKIPLMEGRGFHDTDFAVTAAHEDAQQSNAPPTDAPIPILINQSFARTLNPTRGPLGMRLRPPDPRPGDLPNPNYDKIRTHEIWEIVGIVGDIKYGNLRRPIAPTMFQPWSGGYSFFELRTIGDPRSLIPAVRNIVAKLDSSLPLFGVKTQTETMFESLNQERTIASLSSFFGGLALMLACIGVYGLLSYEVTRRTREIGIRTAVGAVPNDVLRMVVKEGLTLACAGGLIGAVVAFELTRYLRTLLYGISADDPLTFFAAILLLVLVALAACYIPARRAGRLDPMLALRHE